MMSTTPFRVGVSGHQNVGDDATQQFVSEQIRSLLVAYRETYNDIVLYSALALGADQMFVRAALEVGIPVEVVIPCSEYESIFSSSDERNEYTRLLRASRS